MSFVEDMFSSGNGAGFRATGPSEADLANAGANVQGSYQQQLDFVNALNNQGGLANQTNVFNQQQGLANQLQNIGNGQGPNPALAQLNQQTGRNVANQAALMAGQRGGSANTGLMARQAANQGANLQQQAVGQGATLQAQQQLAALQQLQNQQASMGNMANTQVNQRQAGLTGLNQNALQNQANVYGLQSNVNSTNAGIAGGNQAAQGNMLGNMMGAVGSVGNLFGGGGGGAASGGGGLMAGGAGDAIGSGAADLTMIAASGGMVPKYAEGGETVASDPLMDPIVSKEVAVQGTPKIEGPSSKVGQMFNAQAQMPAAPAKSGGGNPLGGLSQLAGPAMKAGMNYLTHEALPYIGEFFGGLGTAAGASGTMMAGGAGDAIIGIGGAAAAPETIAAVGTAAPALAVAAHGGKVPALVSPGEQYIPPNKVKEAAKGKALQVGEKIPGKPKHPGNDYRNDTVKKDLSPGGVVIPNEIMQSKDAEKKAAAFVRDILAKNKLHSKKSK